MGGQAELSSLPISFQLTLTLISNIMASRAGGKQKPLKAPKKQEQVLTDEDLEHKKKMMEEKKKLKEASAAVAGKSGPMGVGGMKIWEKVNREAFPIDVP